MINVDLTTKNTVYNTLGPQAQWVQHRFGRRDYPDVELELDNIISFVDHAKDTVNLISCFGDPCSYTKIIEFLEVIEPGKLVVNTNLNFVNKKIIDALNQKHAYVVLPIFGINDLCDKIVLNSNWNIIHNNLKQLTCGGSLEFYTYEHNKHQVPEIEKIAKDVGFNLKIIPGINTHPDGFSPIVNDKGVWLYDVYPSSNKWKNLEKTVNGYNSLVQYVKPVIGKSILNNPSVYYIEDNFQIINKDISISVTGDVFPSFELHQIFSNALCTDWNMSLSNIKNLKKTGIRDDLKYFCVSIKSILNYLKNGNNINSKSAKDILADLANSNI